MGLTIPHEMPVANAKRMPKKCLFNAITLYTLYVLIETIDAIIAHLREKREWLNSLFNKPSKIHNA